MKNNTLPLSKELKLKLLTILNNRSVSVDDITQINELSGFELTNKVNSLAHLSDEELDRKIAELETKLHK